MLLMQSLSHATVALAGRLMSTNIHYIRPTNHLRNVITTHLHPSRLISTTKNLFSQSDITNGCNGDNKVRVTFLRPDGTKTTVKVEADQDKSLYDAVIDNNVDIDGFGACEGTLCCTTCHLIFKQADFEKVGGPSDEETDMLDLAYGLTDTSRLGCQVLITKDLDPLEVQVPSSINDVREL